ncbi:MAG: Ig-like domain-containing protein [Thermoproteota archaeon]
MVLKLGERIELLRKSVSGIIFTVLVFTMLMLAFNIRSVKSQQTVTIETKLFSYSIYVPAREVRAPNILLTEGTYVRIEFNASEPIDFFCQDSWEYFQSASSGWVIIYYHWSDKTAHMNTTYTIPTTDTWYFTLANYEYHDVDVYNITLYSLEIYEIRLESDKNFYSKGEQVTLTANLNKNGEAMPGNDVVLQVLGPQGDVIFNQSKQTNVYGQVTANFTLPGEDGTYTATAQTIVAGKAIEDTVIFAIDETPPTTLHDYDGLWHTSDLTITLTAIDEVSGITETYYRINGGPVRTVSADGQPCFHIVQAEGAIVIDGDISDWIALGLSPVGTDSPNNIQSYHDVSSDLLEGWAYIDLENLYLSMKVNGDGSYNFDRIRFRVYLTTDTEYYNVAYFDWDGEGVGRLFYWDGEAGMWQMLEYVDTQAGLKGYIEWKVPLTSINNPVSISLAFVTIDDYYSEEVNRIEGAISRPQEFPTSVTEGANHTLEYWSVDNAGNEELPHKILTEIKLDKTAPTGSITIDNNATYATSASVTLMLTATDATSGVYQVRYSNDGVWDTEPWETPLPTRTWTLTSGEGTKTVYYQIKDNAGLVSQSYFDIIILDATSPSILITSPSPGYEIKSSSVVITWTGSDALSGIHHYEIKLDAGSWINVETNTTKTYTGLNDGSHTIDIKAFDQAGNTKEETISFIINTSPLFGPGYLEETVIAATIIIIAIGIVAYILKIRKHKSKS